MRPYVRVVVIGAVATLAIIPLTGVAAAAHTNALQGAPKVGRCYNISGQTANKPATSAHTVACSKRHTLWVVAVTRVPKSVAAARGRGLAKVEKYYESACVPAVRQAIGSTDR